MMPSSVSSNDPYVILAQHLYDTGVIAGRVSREVDTTTVSKHKQKRSHREKREYKRKLK